MTAGRFIYSKTDLIGNRRTPLVSNVPRVSRGAAGQEIAPCAPA